MPNTRELMTLAPVIPVVVIDDANQAVAMAEAFVRGGLPVVEVTLRTAAGLDAIQRIAAAVPGAVVGAGSVLRPDQVTAVKDAGGQFIVSPGATETMVAAVQQSGLSYLPGVASASEVMRLLELGCDCQKFFPASLNGGAAKLKAIGGPIPEVTFCPTGGVSLDNAHEYLSLNNVACVGGSWVAPKAAIASGDWDQVEALAREAAQL